MVKSVGLLSGAGLMAVILAASEPAQACSKECAPPVRLFRPSAQVPGNLVYFKLQTSEPGTLSLKTADGQPIAASIRTIGKDQVFAPDATIAAGTEVVLTYKNNCPGFPGGDEVATYKFRTVDAVATPKMRDPMLQLVAQGTMYPESPTGTAAFADFRYYNADAEGALHHLIDQSASIDSIGTAIKDGMVRVSASCVASEPSVDSCGNVFEVAPGMHTVTVTSRIVGFDAPPPISATVETVCNPTCMISTLRPHPDLGDDTGGDETDGETSKAVPYDVLESGSSSTAGGCSVSNNAGAGAGWLFGALGLLAFSRKRR